MAPLTFARLVLLIAAASAMLELSVTAAPQYTGGVAVRDFSDDAVAGFARDVPVQQDLFARKPKSCKSKCGKKHPHNEKAKKKCIEECEAKKANGGGGGAGNGAGKGDSKDSTTNPPPTTGSDATPPTTGGTTGSDSTSPSGTTPSGPPS